jgi:hypothetical protein
MTGVFPPLGGGEAISGSTPRGGQITPSERSSFWLSGSPDGSLSFGELLSLSGRNRSAQALRSGPEAACARAGRSGTVAEIINTTIAAQHFVKVLTSVIR